MVAPKLHHANGDRTACGRQRRSVLRYCLNAETLRTEPRKLRCAECERRIDRGVS